MIVDGRSKMTLVNQGRLKVFSEPQSGPEPEQGPEQPRKKQRLITQYTQQQPKAVDPPDLPADPPRDLQLTPVTPAAPVAPSPPIDPPETTEPETQL